MTQFVDLHDLAHAASVSRRALQMAVVRIVEGTAETWRGARLVVRTVKGRGGRSGVQYEVAVDSLPDALKAHFNDHFNAPVLATEPTTPNAAKRSLLANVLASALAHPKGTRARAQAVLALTVQPIIDPATGILRRLSRRTIERLIAGYERQGVAALGRQRRSDAGQMRVHVSSKWDAAVQADDATKAHIAEQIRSYIRAQHKNHESAGAIAFKAARKLCDLTIAAGFEIPAAACAVPRSMIAAESVYRRVGQFHRDRKAFADDMPSIRRTPAGLAPMQVIVGDVHPLDFVLPEVEGFQRYAKAICWLDVATNRIWFSVVVLPKGQGVRNEHVIASFIEMATAWGLPHSLYLDNGSEYNWAAFIEDALQLRADRARVIIHAKPYSARSKPIEGIFGRLERHHFAKLPGWIGGDRMKSKTANVGRAPTPFPGDHRLFVQAIDCAVELYHSLPQPRWLGGRSPIDAFNAAIANGWTIANRKFESTVNIPREKIEDDQYGVFGPMFEQLGRMTKQHPDRLIFELLKSGFVQKCYDGQAFFDEEHPARDADDKEILVSNMQAGAGEPWFLLDTTQAVRPLVWQKRIPYEFQQVTSSNDQHVFLLDEYLYGVRARVNAGFGLWQLAFGSKGTLNSANFGAAVAAMKTFRGDRGGVLGIEPSVLVCGPSLETDARELLKATNGPAGATNIWHEAVDLIVSPFLA